MNWYMLWQLSKIKQAELLNDARNHRRAAKRGPKSKTPSQGVLQKLNNRNPVTQIKSRLSDKAAFCLSDKPVTAHPGSSNPRRFLW
jgi:hypothetical protein